MAALAQSGLFYAVNDYDTDRYRKLAALAAELLAAVTDDPAAHWELELGRETGYATPKVDVRGALVDDRERILLMRERSDGLWSLPGGWADPLDTPSRAVEREILEETGYSARAGSWSGVGIGTRRAICRGCRSRSTNCSSSARRPATFARRMRWKPWRSAGSGWTSCRNFRPVGSANGSLPGSLRIGETRCCPPNSTENPPCPSRCRERRTPTPGHSDLRPPRPDGGADREQLRPVVDLDPMTAGRLPFDDLRGVDLFPAGPVDNLNAAGPQHGQQSVGVAMPRPAATAVDPPATSSPCPPHPCGWCRSPHSGRA